ncbi:MAG TPA: ATP-binding protein [Anaeromyxobacteraceae bacterium]|nr:ATP-binding protein [Anaeromyxobacteraceae bacterium]
MKARVRLHLLLQLAALAAVSAALLLAAGIPLVAARAFGPRALVLLVAANSVALLAVGAVILFRWVGRPLDRLLAASARLRPDVAGLPPLGPPDDGGSPGLARAALAFDRTAAALAEERERLAAKVAELEAANARLAEAREGLLRSERLATVGRLAAGIAHEVGNPLGAIAGYAALAREKLQAGRGDAALVDDFLARIAAETARIDAIVRDLLDFARPAPSAPMPVHVAPAVDAALRLARMQPRCRDVSVRLLGLDELPAVVADERRLAQVVLNLLLNAADAMGGRGEVVITGSAEGGAVQVDVADSGPGIPEALRSRVFDPFFTTKEPGQGTGLGLAVCHGIMESFGGTIEVVGERPGGATLRLRLRGAA